MARKGTNDILDYVNDYERAMQDYAEMGPLWAEMVFGDDFEAMKALYGQDGSQYNYNASQYNNEPDADTGKRA